MTTQLPIAESIRAFVLAEFLPGEDPSQLTDTTPLITSGIVDSIATLKLVDFLETKFGISVAAHETDADHLDTVERIVALVGSKKSAA